MAGVTTDANEAPSALADGAEARIAEARGSEKERAERSEARGLRDLRRRFILLRRQAHPRMQKAINTNNQTIPVAPGKAVGTPVKAQQFSGFAAVVLCLRVVPTVGITVGTSVGIGVGTDALVS